MTLGCLREHVMRELSRYAQAGAKMNTIYLTFE